jgi:hypothetical protein
VSQKAAWAVQVVKEARRLGAFCVRGNHDDSALAAYYASQRGEDIDVRIFVLLA